MKKFLAALLAAALAFGLCSCINVTVNTRDTTHSSEEWREFVRGSVFERSYYSDFAQVGFSAPGGWEFEDDYALADRSGMDVLHFYDSEQLAEHLAQKKCVVDMVAAVGDNSRSVMMYCEHINCYAASDPTADDIAREMRKRVRDEDYYDRFSDIHTVTLGDWPYASFIAATEEDESQKYFFRVIGDYVFTVVLYAQSPEEFRALENWYLR